MDKIKSLLIKAGCSADLVESIVASLDNYRTTIKEQFENEYLSRIEEAKKVCIEETESHKRDLSRKLQIFCETKSAAIEAQLARKSALNESEAESRLQNIKDLLEGIEPSGRSNGDITAKIEKAKKLIQVAKEERDRALEIANKKVAIAEKVMKQNRTLVTENAKLKRSAVLSESTGNQRKTKRIDASRSRNQSPITTRSTIVENQDKRPASTNRVSQTITNLGRTSFGVEDIATTMDEDLI